MAKKTEEKVEEAETTEEVKKTTEEATEKATEKTVLKANKQFRDKRTSVIYAKDTEFIVDLKVTETTKVADNQYKITVDRANELKAKKVVD